MSRLMIHGRQLLLGMRWLDFVEPYYTYQCVINPPPDGNQLAFRLGWDLEQLKRRFDVRLFFYADGTHTFRDFVRRMFEGPYGAALLDLDIDLGTLVGEHDDDPNWRNVLAFLRGLGSYEITKADLIDIHDPA